MNKAILLSGGIDSTALTYLYAHEIDLAITIDYGQKAADTEIAVSKRICKYLNLNHEIISLDCSSLASGEMSQNSIVSSYAPAPEWWPFRNQLLITLAAMKMTHYNIKRLLMGTVKTDKKFGDGRSTFFKSINRCFSSQEGSILLEVPAISMTSAQLVIESNIPDNLLLWTHSCHVSNSPCGSCSGCIKYFQVMKKIGIN